MTRPLVDPHAANMKDDLGIMMRDLQTVLSALELSIEHMKITIGEHLAELDMTLSQAQDAYEWLDELLQDAKEATPPRAELN